ncbi:MAG TPA: PEP-CTERM sorting domain-containing protein [Rhodopila sp.]|nr:PEP-CTERM sorting domain-containing protein [Rhodopila sp.]
MKAHFLIAIALGAILTAGEAQASVVFDSITGTQSGGSNGAVDETSNPVNPATTYIGQSFFFTYNATNPVGAIATLSMNAGTPTDGGSVMVYLVANSANSGDTNGVAGNPSYGPTPGGTTFTGLTHDVLLGQIKDSLLTSATSLASVYISSQDFATVSSSTANNEYWIVANIGSGSSANWNYNTGAPMGLGTTGQAFWNNYGGSYGPAVPVSQYSPYMLTVNTPEPATIALLGGGLVGIGYFRRRSARKA